jgi:cell division protein FtsQ
MPLEMRDPDDDESLRASGSRAGASHFGRERFGEPTAAWWRPASALGRIVLGLGILLVTGGSIAGALALKSYLSRDSRFRIAGAGNIEATGLTQVSRAEMLPVFGEDIGRNIFFVPLTERRKQLEAIPWVERATVMRLLPDQIRVSLVERQPVAFVRQGQQIGLVDADGVLLTMPAAMMAQHHYSFPVVTGLTPTDPLPLRKTRMAVYGRLLAELDSNNQRLSEQISEIDLTDPQDARVLMPEQGMDILGHFGDDRFLERYQRYKSHIAEWRAQYPKLAAVDLRYDSQVVLEMTAGTNAVQAAVSGETAPDATKPASAPKLSASETADASNIKPAPAKLAATKPAPSAKPTKPDQPQPTVKQASTKQSLTKRQKAHEQKAASAETLATKQREARARTAKEKAARDKAAKDKAAKDKKHAAPQQAALVANPNRQKPSPSTRPAQPVAPGQ